MKTIVTPEKIDFLDERFYTLDNENFYPSVTHILDAYPKGYGFNQWLKDLGMNADQVLERAGQIGSKVHDAINKLLLGEEITWDDKAYGLDEWIYILRFAEFWHEYKPELLATETSLVSSKLGFGGTLDLVCKLGAVVWLIDFKTSNAIYNSYELQVGAYRALWNEYYPESPIERAGVFWFKSQTRGADKTGKKIQGAGWQLHEYTRNWQESYKLFDATFALWKNENPNAKPKNREYPVSIKLNLG